MQEKYLELKVDENILKIKMNYQDNPTDKLILMVHGFGGYGFDMHFEETGKLFYEAGYNVVRFLFSGYEGSIKVEDPSIKGQIKELNVLMDYFKKYKIILLAPAIKPAKGLRNEFEQLDKDAIKKLENNKKFIFEFINKQGVLRKLIIHPSFWTELKDINDFNYKSNKPVLIFQGRNDEKVDINDVKDFYKNLETKKKIILTEGLHVQTRDEKIRRFIVEKSIEWFKEINL